MPLRLTLTGLASQYIHMPLAPFCLKKAVDESGLDIQTTICDLNINDTQEDLLHRVMATQPDVLGLSLYIWNRECAARLIRRVKALKPEIIVIVGGPEATFSVDDTFHEMPIDYLLRGAGEESLPALLHAIMEGGDAKDEGVKVIHQGAEREILTDSVLLAIGHSARDTMQRLFNQGVMMVQKPFAMGVRIEHPQSLISQAQYGKAWQHPALGAADYKLAVHTPDKRGCYTFCMCPGGEVIAAASQEGGLCVNGMSYHARAGRNANAALLVGVNPEDFGDDHPLAGFVWQRSIEQAAYRLGGSNYHAPVQRVEDLLNSRATKSLGDVIPTYQPGVTPADLRECLPGFIIEDLKFGIRRMDGQLRGFAHPDAVLTGVETRSSSPVRLNRDRVTLMAEGLDGLFPVGEGAGYAGGIVSAAVDGIVAARAALERSTL